MCCRNNRGRLNDRTREEVFYMGAPWGVYHPPTVPIFKGTFSGKISDSSSLFTVPGAPGASGSAIMTNNNKVVGVLFAVHPGLNHITIATDYKATLSFLITARKKLTSSD